MREIARQKCLLGFFFPGSSNARPTAEAPKPIFTQNTPNDAVPRNDVPFGVRKQKNSI